MKYAFASTTKAMTAIRTLLAVMVFLAISVATVLIAAAHAVSSHLLGLFDSLLSHALRNAVPVCTAKFATICCANVVPHVSHDVRTLKVACKNHLKAQRVSLQCQIVIMNTKDKPECYAQDLS